MSLKLGGSTVVDSFRGVSVVRATGNYTELDAKYTSGDITTSTHTVDFRIPFHLYTIKNDVTFSFSNTSSTLGAVVTFFLYTDTAGYTPTWPSDVIWPGTSGSGDEPNWSSHKVWLITFMNVDTGSPVQIRSVATPYSDAD